MTLFVCSLSCGGVIVQFVALHAMPRWKFSPSIWDNSFEMLSWWMRCRVGVFSLYKMTLLECSPSGGSVAAKCTNCCIADENSSLPYMRQLFWNAFLVDEMPGRCKLFNLSHCITCWGDLQPYKPTSWDASFWQYGITKSWHCGLWIMLIGRPCFGFYNVWDTIWWNMQLCEES